MSDQFNDVQLDIRDRYSVRVRDNRLYEGPVPTIKKTIDMMESPTHLFGISSLAELTNVTEEYKEHLEKGSMAVLFDINNIPCKVFSWSGDIDGWKEIGAISVTGPILTPATEKDTGIVQLASHTDTVAGKVVQSDDPRLEQEIAVQVTEPTNKEVIWIDTSNPEITIKAYDGTSWIIISGKSIIDDSNPSTKTTMSSDYLSKALNKKANDTHTHSSYDAHETNTSNPHKVKATQLEDLHLEIDKNIEVAKNSNARHAHNNKAVLNGFSESSVGEPLYNGKQIYKGDMKKEEFDKDGDGIVDAAKNISNGVLSFSIVDMLSLSNKSHAHANANILNATEAVFTNDLKTKLEGLEKESNKYVHPDKHDASIITEDPFRRFVSDVEKAIYADKYTKTEVDTAINSKEDKNKKGKAGGYASLDSTGHIPISQIPLALKETRVVKNIAERNLLNKYSGLRAFVVDASADPNVPQPTPKLASGLLGAGEVTTASAEYVWSGTEWLITTSNTPDAGETTGYTTWSQIIDGPDSTPMQIDSAVAKSHEHANKSILDSINYVPLDKNGDNVLGRINFAEGPLKGLAIGTTASVTVNDISGDGAKELCLAMLNNNPNSVINILSPSDNVQINGHAILHAGNISNVVSSSAISDMRVGIESDRVSSTFPDGTLYFALDSKRIYLYTGGTVVSFLDTEGSQMYNVYKQKEFFSATAGATTFTLSQGHYKPGTNTVSVYISGSRIPHDSFTETSPNEVVLTTPIISDVQILIEYIDSDKSDTLADGSYPVAFQQEVYVLGPTDTVVQIHDGLYKPNSNTISLYIDGIRQPEVCFIERSNNEIELKAPIGDTVQVMVEYVDSTRTISDDTGTYKFLIL